ncbi:SAM-dependent methyltransferase [Anaeromicropila populeti]|uniref:Cyclopropane-fatty-acyl-phospholipid synthase n=1 Tax=Anaeromicropila populeti TaxID=37658 RepID=A0A1I6JLL8_9FIRM|nr:cyclopropane-fatty-acyl-phospholipid synthase family protein [Anaeromicropila populeti]SFR79876.1 cyclopropane-fatty-acyl-phospholipid synthase [Anaeromicropila populeti]
MNAMDNYIIQYFNEFNQISFMVKYKGEKHIIGKDKPRFTVNLLKEIPKKDLLNSTSLALGEAYIKGDLVVEENIFQVLPYFLSQIDKFSLNKYLLKKLQLSSHSKYHEKANASYHYDIGNDFFKLWLDDTMSYSCGYFRQDNNTLYEAQINKTHYVLEKLCLQEGMSVLDIGCGCGFLLLEAAKKYKVKGYGITLSKEQYKEFQQKIEEEKLEDMVTVRYFDYRDISRFDKKFDRVVSIEMLEHVGRENYDIFIKTLCNVLKPDGLVLLHFISSLEERSGDPWIRKYIFPGGVVPSLREVVWQLGENKLQILDVENLRLHYCKTLRCWYDQFQKNRQEIEEKFGERFVRTWELYLCSCEAAFQNGIISLHQILLCNGTGNKLPAVRWY